MTGSFVYRKPQSLSSMPYYLDRPRLNKIMALALQNPVVTVVAGQGCGKTSAVYSFLENNSIISMWVQLAERDNISRHFWENMCSCVALRNPDLGNALLELGFPETDRQYDRFYVLIEQAVKARRASLPPSSGDLRYAAVFDDFHEIQSAALLRLFDHILAYPLLNTSIIIIARTEPRIKNLPLLSKGLLARITVEDLRFTPEEMTEYFAMQRLKVSPEDAESFWRDTEGWPQILSLIAQDTIKRNRTEIRYSPELVKHPLFRMIESSFFSSLDRATRRFFIKLSLGEYWPIELLDKLDSTGEKREGLEKISPLIRYDSYLNGYRIHNLLAEFLREKQHELSEGERRDVYRKNAEWCLDNNLRLEAAIYYEKARDYRGFLNLSLGLPSVIPGEIASFFLSIIERLPSVDEKDAVAGDEGPEWRETILYLRSVTRSRLLFAMSRFDEAAAVCREAIAEFEKRGPDPFNERILTPLYFCLGFTMIIGCRHTGDYNFSPCFEKAYHYFKSHTILVTRSFRYGIVSSYVCQVGFPAREGAFEEFLRAYSRAAPLIVKVGDGHLAGLDSLGRCEYCYFRGDLRAAENFARQAIIQARGNRQYETENRGLFYLLRIAVHTGNYSEIEELFRQLKAQLVVKEFQNRYVLYDIECSWFYAQAGETALITSWLLSYSEVYEVNDILRPLENLVKAKCFYAQKRCREALSVLEMDKSLDNLDSFFLGKLEKTALEAVCRLRLGDNRAAVEKLGEARELSRRYGLDTPFVELGEDMRLLATLALDNTKTAGSAPAGAEEPEYGKLLRGHGDREWLESIRKRAAVYSKMAAGAAAHGPAAGPGAANAQKDDRIVLRRREKAVLYALSRGFTREEIARRENISLNAVKEIIKSIYQKLGAVNRADAVRIALVSGILKKVSR
jgi:LuxR family maltose regulon positive regulatory protein